MDDERIGLPQGTLDLLILKALSVQPMHGWAISERLRQVSRAALQVPQGSLYPALHRLERRGWIRASGARRRTTAGRSITSLRARAASSSSGGRGVVAADGGGGAGPGDGLRAARASC